MDDLKIHLEFEREFANVKKTDYDNGIMFLDYEEVPPIYLGFLDNDADDNFSYIRDLCRKFFIHGVKCAKAKEL